MISAIKPKKRMSLFDFDDDGEDDSEDNDENNGEELDEEEIMVKNLTKKKVMTGDIFSVSEVRYE